MATRFLARPGGHLAYDDTGDADGGADLVGATGPLVVCAPGVGDRRQLYRFLRPRLTAAGYRVATLDLRGHGESSTGWRDYSPEAVGDDLLALVQHLAPDRPAVLVGESFTPASAAWTAAEAPHLVAGVVLIAPAITPQRPGLLVRAARAAVTRSPALWVHGFYRFLYPTAPPPDFRAYRRALHQDLRQHGRMAALRAMVAAPTARAYARLAEVACPVLVLMGSRDPDHADPRAEAQAAADAAPDGTVAMIDDAGHYPPAEMPSRTAEALLPFLARVWSTRDDTE